MSRSRWRFRAVAYALGLVLATSNLPTPLYGSYQRLDHLSTLTLTLVFVAYVVTVAATLAVAGQVSDLLGRRAVLMPAMCAALASTVCFAVSASLPWLVAGRILTGAASGALTGAGPAALADTEPGGDVGRASLVASAATVIGLAVGPMVSGLLVQYAPWPDRLVYLVALPALAVGLAGVAGLPPGHGGVSELRRVRRPEVPPAIRPVFTRTALAFAAGWVGTAMFFALGPTFAGLVLRTSNRAVATAIVFEVFVVSALAQLVSRRLPAGPASSSGLVVFSAGMAVLPLALWWHAAVLLAVGAAAVGAGQGLTHRASQAALLEAAPLDRRGQIAAAFYLSGYAGVAVVLVSLGFLIDATSPLAGLSGFAALTITAALAAAGLGLTGRLSPTEGHPAASP